MIGFDRQNNAETVDFCKERQLEYLIEKFAVEYSIKPKELYLVAPSRPTKELNLIKSPLGKGMLPSMNDVSD